MQDKSSDTELQAMIADVLAGTTGGTARTDAYISALMLRLLLPTAILWKSSPIW